MLQQWLNLTGLSFDFVGVLMLANEWRISIEAEKKEIEIAEQERRFRPHPMTPQSQNPHQAVFDRVRDDQRFRQRINRAHTARGERSGWFATAFFFIVAGFALQVIGSWPGGFLGLVN